LFKKSTIKLLIACVCLLVAVSIGAVGCGSTNKVDTSKSVYKIGAVLSLTGPAAPLGTSEQKALTMFQDELNSGAGVDGHKVEFIIVDDQSSPEQAKAAITKLINQEGVSAIVGTSSTGATLAMVPVAQQNKVPMVCCAAGTAITDPVKSYVFRTPPTDRMAITKVLEYLKNTLKISKIAILHDSNAFGTGGADELAAKAAKYGIQIVANESYGSTDTDMTPQLTKIKGTPAQALVVWGTNPGPASIAKNMQQLSITIPYVGSHGIANQKFIELAGPAANGVVFPAGRMLIPASIPANSEWRKLVDTFYTNFKAKYQSNPDTFAGHGYDAGLLITDAMKTAGTDKTKLQEAIQSTDGVVGIDGTFTYSPSNHDGLKTSDLIMIKVQNGTWTELK